MRPGAPSEPPDETPSRANPSNGHVPESSEARPTGVLARMWARLTGRARPVSSQPAAAPDRVIDHGSPATVASASGGGARPGDGADEPVWATAETAGWTDPPRLAGDVDADLCVIGLGGSGLAAVAEALDVGRTVVGIDAGPVAGRAAGRNGGFLLAGTALFHHDAVRRFGRERALAWYRGTVAEIDRFVATDPAVRRVGSLRLAADDQEAADVERQLAAMHEDGLEVEPWDGPAGVGLLVPDDAVANPLVRCRHLAMRCLDAGAMLFSHSPALTVAGNRIDTPDGVVRCRQVIVAVDGALGSILPELAPRVRPVRLQMLGTAPTDEVSIPRPVYARWGLDYWSQTPDGRIALGGGRDHGGDEEEGAPAEPSTPVQAHLDELLRSQIGVSATVTHRWAARVGFTQSGLPVCEQVRPGVWAIGGYSGTGNVIGAMLGRIAVELAVSGSSERADLLYGT